MSLDLGDWAIGWREGVVALITLVAAYMAFVLLRVGRLGRKALPAARAEPAGPEAPAESASPEPMAWQEAPDKLARDAFMAGVEAELAQLREETDALRGEVAALREELHAELGHLRASQTVSPLYSDAMQMATAGHDPATIAECCGISRAEAELVVALVKSQNPDGGM